MPDPNPSPAPAPNDAPAPAPGPGNDSSRFAPPPAPADGLPEGIDARFLREGKLDTTALHTSYKELETKLKTKTDDLKVQLDAERLAKRPAAADQYTVPALEGVNPDEFGKSPIVDFWRKQAFDLGMDQEGFETGVKAYLDAAASADFTTEIKALGDNGQARIDAVTVWAQNTFTDPAEFREIQKIGVSAAGIKVLEKLMGGGKLEIDPNSDTAPEPAITIEKLRSMQQDPRYYDSAKRDPAFVKQVDDGYAKLYPPKP